MKLLAINGPITERYMSWIKASWIALLLIVSAGAAHAKQCFWEVQGEHSKVYILGSLPMIPASVYPLPQVIDVAYQSSEHVVFEFDPYLLFEGVRDPARKFKILYNDQAPTGPTALYDEISGELFGRVLDAAQKLTISPEQIQRFRPPFVGIYLHLMQMDNLGYQRGNGMDIHFQDRMTADQKSFAMLNNLDQYLARFVNLNFDQQVRMTQILLDMLDDPERMSQGILDAWNTCDTDTLESTLNTPLRQEPEIAQTIIEQPTALWSQKIRALAKTTKRDVFIVVDIPRLTGEQGLIQRLRNSGLRVRQY